MKAGGIDLGGTKIEAQAFDQHWNVADKRRIATPAAYDDLVAAMAEQVSWLRQNNPDLPVGVAAAGLANPETGTWIAANLAADGNPFVADVAKAISADLTWLNDCRAFTQAEAIFGSADPAGTLVGLVLGTGIAGGVAIDGVLVNGGEGQSGEFGHMPVSGHVLARYGLPILECGCGRAGCYETYGSGPGMERLARHLAGRDMTTRGIARKRKDADVSIVWEAWCDVNAALLLTIVAAVDPQRIVLGGGISRIPDLTDDLEAALKKEAWQALPLPSIQLSPRGETAAALGAAYSAWHG